VDNHGLFAASPHLLSGIHPNEAGYRALGDAWFDALAPRLGAAGRPPQSVP
jgi:lysophospholipase L1-like esterase